MKFSKKKKKKKKVQFFPVQKNSSTTAVKGYIFFSPHLLPYKTFLTVANKKKKKKL